MKKKLLYIALVAVSTSIFALSAEEKAAQEQENMKMLASMGLPLPGSGIKVVPRAMMNLSQEQLEKGAKEDEEFKEKGYVTTYTNRPRELLNFQATATKEISLSKRGGRDNSTDLRSRVKDIKLAFDYKGINQNKALSSGSDHLKVFAAVPQGGFHEDKGGWSGVAEYFVDRRVGVCSYGIMNVKASNTAAQLALEDVSYVINNKATLIQVEGSDNSGFLYSVKWYDDNNFHELECANMKYSANITHAVIGLANEIDNV